jgi:transposase-like protein
MKAGEVHTNNSGLFPENESLLKPSTRPNKHQKKWTLSISDWKAALNRFTIQLHERMPQH